MDNVIQEVYETWNLETPRPLPADISVTPSWAVIQWPDTLNSSNVPEAALGFLD